MTPAVYAGGMPSITRSFLIPSMLLFVGLGAAGPEARQAAPAQASPLGSALATTPTVEALRAWHDLLGTRPHDAGTPGDRAVIAAIAGAFEGMGLDTEIWWFEPLLSRPVSASLRIVGDDTPLPLVEDVFEIDPATGHPELRWGWNAYSGSGTAEAGVIYANRGTREDFARLRELGIDCTGRIVLARYGGNYRGYKARFAEEAGAVGLVVYTDPGDSGDDRGAVWPDGGWANDSYIQRGSMVTLPYKGDPLTPGRPAIDGVPRLEIDEVDLPGIPIQPIGYAAASRIMAAMNGPRLDEVATDGSLDAWAGGLEVPYRIDGGDLRLRLEVEQVREPMRTANVFGVLPGTERPEELVIVGGHHDAWGFGAADPLAGTIVTLETARAFAEAADRGLRPRRTVVFAAWGAEEYGIIGSSEWVEAQRDRLLDHAVAYVNLDMAAMGTRFFASASPSVAAAVVEAAGMVMQPEDEADADTVPRTVAETWAGERGALACGDLGGGSDHVGFLCHAGVPSIQLKAGGGRGVSYHSSYDTLGWYRANVGEDYIGALMLTQVNLALVAALADAEIPPVDPAATVATALRRLDGHEEAAIDAGLHWSADALRTDGEAALEACERARARVEALAGRGEARDAAAALRSLDRVWLEDGGLPGRAWYANTFATSDRDSGYGAVVLPLLAEAIRDRDQAALDQAIGRYRATFERIRSRARDIGG